MDRLTDIATFYNRLAPEYDLMTGFERRIASEASLFKSLVDRYAISIALDAGSGTGFHSVVLAQLGVQVTALDVSRDMLDQLERHAREKHLTIRTLCANFLDIPTSDHASYDAVFCMGNSLPHILSREELRKTIQGFAVVLKPGGALFVQILNYDRIMSRRESIQSVKEAGGKIFVRYYEFGAETLRFNILTLTRNDAGIRHSLDSVALRPIFKSELLDLLPDAGLTEPQFFGNIALEPFDTGSSKDLFFIARKS